MDTEAGLRLGRIRPGGSGDGGVMEVSCVNKAAACDEAINLVHLPQPMAYGSNAMA